MTVRLLLLALLVLATPTCGGSSSGGSASDDAASADVPVGGEDVPASEDIPDHECQTDADCEGRFATLGPCETAVCIARTGTCERARAADHTPCDDGDACSEVSSCREGTCVGGLEKGCDDGDPCTRDSCDEGEGGCVHAAIAGVLCDDGNPCTLGDRCQATGCAGDADLTCTCTTDADCAPREDGDLCNGTLTCTGGQCTVDPATVVRCDTTGDATCRPTTCDPATGACAPAAVADGAACEDGNLCTDADTCQAGECVAGAYVCTPCSTAEDCAAHDDGNPCNGGVACVDKKCAADPSTAPVCEPSGPCVASVCSPTSGACEEFLRDDGSRCEDGDPCTAADYCQSGQCRGGGAATCEDDGDPCTDELCVAGEGCASVPGTGAACDDGDACTVDDACAEGLCTGGPRPCEDGDPCTADTCEDGACVARAAATGEACDDGDACTADEVCDDFGVCRGQPVVCDDADPCTEEECDPTRGCVVVEETPGCRCTGDEDCADDDPCTRDFCEEGARRCAHQPALDGTPCGPALDECHTENLCIAGVCETGPDIVCDDGVPCTTDTCDPALGCLALPGPACQCLEDAACADDNPCTDEICDTTTWRCLSPGAPEGTPCDDGSLCTEGDGCDGGGACLPGSAVDCRDIDSCTRDACDPTVGCTHEPEPDGTPCDDLDGCTAPDLCTEGHCTGPNVCGGESDCHDGVDDDSDGQTDCDDEDCDNAPACTPERLCGDARDNDFDGATDCDDDDCETAFNCRPETICNDRIDNDFDNDVDCDDADCASAVNCRPETACGDDIDNDADGATDCDDTDCDAAAACQPEAACADDNDNDNDGATDCDDTDCDAAPACVPETDCTNGLDDDGDGPRDCADDDCARDVACVDLCTSPRAIACGDLLAGDNTGLASLVDEQPCTGWSEPGGEIVYRFTAPRTMSGVVASVVGTSMDPDLFVLGEACDPRSCIANGSVEATFDVAANQVYYLVVDGYEFDPAGAFTVTLTCPSLPLPEDNCFDGVDNDGDGGADCADDDCAGFPACAGPTCGDGDYLLACDEVDFRSTAGAGSEIDTYACSGMDESGADIEYAFTAPADGDVTVVLTPLGAPAPDLDLYVLEDACRPAACVAPGSEVGAERVTFTARAGHTYYVVVEGYAGDEGDYELGLQCGSCASDALEPNNAPATARALTASDANGLTVCPGDDDYYAVTLCAGAIVLAEATFTDALGDIDLYLVDPSGAIVESDEGIVDNASLIYTATTAGRHLVRVLLAEDAGTTGNGYGLHLEIDESGCP